MVLCISSAWIGVIFAKYLRQGISHTASSRICVFGRKTRAVWALYIAANTNWSLYSRKERHLIAITSSWDSLEERGAMFGNIRALTRLVDPERKAIYSRYIRQ